MGWLSAKPEGSDKVRCERFDKEDPYFVMPDVSGFEHIVRKWDKSRRFKRGAMSHCPLDWQDIFAFSHFCDVTEFEAEMIMRMSEAFVSGLMMTDKNDRAPYQREYNQEEWQARERSIDLAMRKSEDAIKNATK